MNVNKFITVALALTAMVGLVWAFMPKGLVTLPVQTPTITVTANQAPESLRQVKRY